MRIEWDIEKARRNQQKHGLSFNEASLLFHSDADYLEIFDEAHSVTEDRLICIGAIHHGVIVVVKTEPDDNTIRILSARLATRRETQLYLDYLEGRYE